MNPLSLVDAQEFKLSLLANVGPVTHFKVGTVGAQSGSILAGPQRWTALQTRSLLSE